MSARLEPWLLGKCAVCDVGLNVWGVKCVLWEGKMCVTYINEVCDMYVCDMSM